jgi:hypothetical protein
MCTLGHGKKVIDIALCFGELGGTIGALVVSRVIGSCIIIFNIKIQTNVQLHE